ncbi:MAG: polymer-forming cytoskeletal protein [Leptospirales bacterium]|nr:polymer-forming cytoskeletal protein [Leptospirales bacterium]
MTNTNTTTKEIIEDENKIETVIADDILFKGTIKFRNSLKIKGRMEGRIETDGHLIIGQEAVVSADINGRVVTVNGEVNGKIKASQKVELMKKSITRGDIITPDISIENGSIFNGTCLMEEKTKSE